ncbi:hypothetical protein ACFWYW_55670 [Nonomuraea sp. NPDC059023]|uniref:hypothetical protein n=1 Tax=unclassified Nonomuraea TaxID=2593643 RepID=UPI00369C4484
MNDQQLSVPVEAYTQVLEEQRNNALNDAAQMKALALHLKAELDQASAELEKLRADA